MILCPIHESNDCHTPAGSADGGQFCSTAASGGFADLIARATKVRDRGRTWGAAILKYDESRKGKPGYNPDALPQILGVMAEVQIAIEQGMPVRDALIKDFDGPLLENLLQAVGEPKSTKQERARYAQPKPKGKK